MGRERCRGGGERDRMCVMREIVLEVYTEEEEEEEEKEKESGIGRDRRRRRGEISLSLSLSSHDDFRFKNRLLDLLVGKNDCAV